MTAFASKASRAAVGQESRGRSGLGRIANGLVVLALATIALALSAAVAPRLVGFEGLAITSGSMGEAAPVGSLVLMRDRLAAEVRVGDVIALERPGHPLVVHRVLAIETVDGRPVAETKGDANPTPDPEPYALPAQVPVMARAIPLVGHLVALLKVPLGWLLLIALPATVVAAAMLRDLWFADEDASAVTPASAAVVDLQPALDAARAEHEALRERAGHALTAMKRELDESREEVAALQVDAPAEVAVALAPQLAAARRESEELRERLRATEARLHEALAPDRRLPELERHLREARAEIGSLRTALAAAAAVADKAAAADPRVAELGRALEEARAEAGEIRAELDAAEARLAEAAAAELLLVRLGQRVADLEAAAPPEAPPDAAEDPAGPYLLYAATPSGYRLHVQEGPLPRPGEGVVLDGRTATVVRLGASPLPGDRRRCAFVVAA